jgi:hypothetical protein
MLDIVGSRLNYTGISPNSTVLSLSKDDLAFPSPAKNKISTLLLDLYGNLSLPVKISF